MADLNRSAMMKESGNPKAAMLLAGAFAAAMAGAACLVAIDNLAVGGPIFSMLFVASLSLLLAGLVVSWKGRKKKYEFVEPTKAVPRLLLKAFRIVAGLVLTVSGGFMIYLSIAMFAHGQGFPVTGLVMGALIFGFGFYGLRAGLKNGPNQASEPTSAAVTPPADAGDRASVTRGSP